MLRFFLIALLFFSEITQYSFLKLNMKKDNMSKNKLVENVQLYEPRTTNQRNYLNCLDNLDINLLIADGPAGCGKTLFACQKSIDLLKNNIINKIVITRPLVTVEEEIGFLPGNLIEKMDPWTKPIIDIFLEYYSANDIKYMIHNNIIEICPLAFMRGRTFKNCYIIADEMQNCTPNQMKMITTRIGINCKMVVTGDINQSDLKGENGFYDFIKRYDNYNKVNQDNSTIKVITLDKNDIHRSLVTIQVLNIYNFYEEKENLIKTIKPINFDEFYKSKPKSNNNANLG
jgi:phosphate starvation-inducible PhoH-like protein